MDNTFFVDIDKLLPTHYYLSKDRLIDAQKHFESHSLEDYPPLPVMKLGNKILLLGKHHYAYYIYLQGKHIAEVFDAKDDINFVLHMKNYNDCIRKKILNIKDLERRLLKQSEYNVKWQKPFENNKIKINENPIKGMKIETIIDYDKKADIIYNILSPMPKYFANKYIFENYINKTKDMHFMAFNLFNQTVAFSVCKEIYDNTIEIYMLGTYEQMQKTDISDKNINAIKKYTKKSGRKYIIAKVPVITAGKSESAALFDFYTNHGFSHIANLQAPWDEKRICMLLITH